MSLPGTVARPTHTNNSLQNALDPQSAARFANSRQSAAGSVDTLENQPVLITSMRQSLNQPRRRGISRREYFRDLIPQFGNLLTKGLRSANLVKHDLFGNN